MTARPSRPVPPLPSALRLSIIICLAAIVAVVASPGRPARADDYCDTTEAVACIPMPDDSGTAAAAAGAQGAAAPSNGPQIAAVPAPCAPSSCCSGYVPPASASAASAPAIAAVPVTVCAPASTCTPLPLGAAAPAVPVPQPALCSPYRGIYATINLGNSADVRALSTLSTTGLRSYWRQSALQQIVGQVGQLQAAGSYATARLYSIQVLNSDVDFVDNTATVHTMEHWFYQQNSSVDGSVTWSQDEWVANEYDLTSLNGAWYITGNTTSIQPGPVPVPASN